MAETPSTMVPLGIAAPDFMLPDTVSGNIYTLNDLKSEAATVVMFICNHCPFVKHLNTALADFSSEYINKGISFIAINSNDAAKYTDDSPENMKLNARRFGFRFPYLFDETQEVAKAYKATCTPDFFVYDKDLLLVYRGQFDDSRPGNGKAVTGRDMREALDNILSGHPVSDCQKPSIGCNIKWK